MKVFIVNLKAGKGKAAKYIKKIKSYPEKGMDKFDVVYTEFPGHATEIAHRYSKMDDMTLYSLGGDGTLNEVVNGSIGTNTVVIDIPTGSGNDFIKSITDIRDPFEIFKRSLSAQTKTIDTMRVNDRYCINIASVGLDATVAYNAKMLKKVPLISGSLAYFLSIFITLVKYKAYKLNLCIDSEEYKVESLLIAIANGKYYGGGMKAVPDAVIDDGYLDICMVKNMKLLKILSLLSKYKKGKHVGLKEVTMKRAKKIRIESEEKLQINIDGEITEGNIIEIEIIPDSLKIAAI
jgi:YegS/Rv2252/BmrU family lipid kinase